MISFFLMIIIDVLLRIFRTFHTFGLMVQTSKKDLNFTDCIQIHVS